MNLKIIIIVSSLVILLLGIIIGYLVAKLYFYIKLQKERKKAIENSKKIILGQVNEKIIPLLPNFKYNTKDLVFIGKGFDYLVLNGLSEGNLKEIVFIEIKTGKSTLNKNEKQIKNIIENKKVRYELIKIEKNKHN